jgi:hypothetical protein
VHRTPKALLVVVLWIAVGVLAPIASASGRCVSIAHGAPCLGPIQSSYAFAGLGGGATGAIHAKAGPQEEIGKDGSGNPITRRTFTWHSVGSVKIVAVYVSTEIGLTGKYRYRRIPTGSHSGHATLINRWSNSPQLLLEGSR